MTYFSATGTTKRAALALADYLGADTFEIVPEVPYSSADLNWNDRQSRSSKEMDDEGSRPGIVGQVDDMDAYETIYVGFPIWWYVEPRIIDTFLESYDMTGKTVVPFATSGGSGLGKTAQHMQEVCPQAIVEQGFMLNDYSAVSCSTIIQQTSSRRCLDRGTERLLCTRRRRERFSDHTKAEASAARFPPASDVCRRLRPATSETHSNARAKSSSTPT